MNPKIVYLEKWRPAKIAASLRVRAKHVRAAALFNVILKGYCVIFAQEPTGSRINLEENEEVSYMKRLIALVFFSLVLFGCKDENMISVENLKGRWIVTHIYENESLSPDLYLLTIEFKDDGVLIIREDWNGNKSFEVEEISEISYKVIRNRLFFGFLDANDEDFEEASMDVSATMFDEGTRLEYVYAFENTFRYVCRRITH